MCAVHADVGGHFDLTSRAEFGIEETFQAFRRCFLWSFLVVRNCRKFWVTHFSLKKLHSFSWSWGTFWRSAWFFFFHPWFTFSSCTWSDTNTLKILPRISTLLGFLQCFISLWSCCCNRKDSSVTCPRTLIHNLLTLYSSREHTQLHLVLFVFMLLRLYYCCNDSQSFYPGPRRRGREPFWIPVPSGSFTMPLGRWQKYFNIHFVY